MPPHPRLGARVLRVRYLRYVWRYGAVDSEGVSSGALDPFLGLLPLTATRIGFGGIYSIAVWRRVPWIETIAGLLLLLPVTAVLGDLCWSSPNAIMLLLLLAMAATTLGFLAIVLGVRATFVRIVGAHATLTLRIDRPLLRRRRFHDELLRRCGLEPSPIP